MFQRSSSRHFSTATHGRRAPGQAVAWLMLCLLLSVHLGTTPAEASESPLRFFLRPSQGSLLLTHGELGDGAGVGFWASLAVDRPPQHGQVESTGSSLRYIPEPSFWTLGSDSFSIRIGLGGAEFQLHRVYVQAMFHGRRQIYEPYEPAAPPLLSLNATFAPQVLPEAALSGQSGLRVSIGPSTYGSLAIVSGEGGGGPDSGGNCMLILPPPPRLPDEGGPRLSLFRIGDDILGPAFELDLLQVQPLRLEAMMRDDQGVIFTTGPVDVPGTDGARLIHLDWWKATSIEPSGGLLLLVDGVRVAEISQSTELESIGNVTLNTTHQELLRWAHPSATAGLMYLDELELRTGVAEPHSLPEAYPAHEAVLIDDFEVGDLARWSNPGSTRTHLMTDQQDPKNRLLAVDFSEFYPRFLIDNSPAGERAYGARFRLELSDLVMADFERVMIFGGANAENAVDGSVHTQVWLRYRAGAYQVRVSYKDLDQPGKINSPWYQLSGLDQVLAVQWQASTHANGRNGVLRLWVGGEVAAELLGLESDDMVMESVRLGAKNVGVGTSGIIYLDDYESWRPAPVSGDSTSSM